MFIGTNLIDSDYHNYYGGWGSLPATEYILGDLGRFRFTARSQATKEGGDAFSRSNLQPPRTVYVPGKAVKLAAAQASYSFFDPTQKPESNNPADPNGTPGNASQGGDPSSTPGSNH